MNKEIYKFPLIISVAMLFLAVLSWPYGYYNFLRLIVAGSAIYYAYVANGIKKESWMWVFIVSAILFNPLIPVRLTREMWAPINIILPIIWIVGFKKIIQTKT